MTGGTSYRKRRLLFVCQHAADKTANENKSSCSRARPDGWRLERVYEQLLAPNHNLYSLQALYFASLTVSRFAAAILYKGLPPRTPGYPPVS